MAFVLRLFQCKSSPLLFWIGRNVTMSNSLFALAIVVQLLLVSVSPELVVITEKAGRSISDKLNLGVAALAFILVAYAYFWLRFWPTMDSLAVNLALGLLQVGSLYIASFYLRKMREDDKSEQGLMPV